MPIGKKRRRTTKKDNLLPLLLAGGGAYLLATKGAGYVGGNLQITNVRLGYGNLITSAKRTKPDLVLYLTVKNNSFVPVPIQYVYAEIYVPGLEEFAVGKFEAATREGELKVVPPGGSIEIGVQGGVTFSIDGFIFTRKNYGTGADKKYYDDLFVYAFVTGKLTEGIYIKIRGFLGYGDVRIPFERDFLKPE